MTPVLVQDSMIRLTRGVGQFDEQMVSQNVLSDRMMISSGHERERAALVAPN